MSVRDWADLSAPAFADLGAQTVAILPTAAVEQHGPHLPVGTDTLIANGMLDAFRAACPADIDALILPTQSVGKSNEHLWAPGTLTLTAQTALAAWTDIGLSVARAGVYRIVIVNAHGGNLDLVSILSRELRVQADMLAIKCQWSSFGTPAGLYGDTELQYGIHGGDVETSLMLHFRPDTVDMTKAADNRSSAETTPVAPIGPVSYGWIASDLNASGTVGDASAASAQKGRATCAHQIAGFIDLIYRVAAMPRPGH